MVISPLIIALAVAQPAAEAAPARPTIVLPVFAQESTVPATTEPENAAAPPADENVIIVEGSAGGIPGDPLDEVNAATFEAMDAVDDAVVEPIAHAYRDDLPKPIRNGLSNFFANLGEPIVFINDVLQLKPGRAARTLGRFAVNSTVGVAGLVDVAKKQPFNLPRRRNGLANTLGYYGVGPGPFLVLPLIGATTLRDVTAGVLDQMILPQLVGKPFTELVYRAPAFLVTSLDARIEFDDELIEIRQSDSPYDTLREIYLARRKAEIDALRARRGVAPVSAPTPDLPE